ncbi:MAG: PqqD family protein [Anaerolineales bacterium]|jgi:hypothetical protein
MLTLESYPIPVPGVVGRLVEDEAVLVLPERGEVKVLNEVGARIWDLANGQRAVSAIAALICEEYEVDLEVAASDTLEFLADLESRGVIRVSDKPE